MPSLASAIESFNRDRADHRYARALKRVDNHAPPDADISWIADPDNLRLIVEEIREAGLAPSTEQREMAAYSALLKEHFGSTRRTEVMERIKLRRKKPSRTRWMTKDEIKKIRRVMEGDKFETLFSLLLTTGLRRSEALALTPDDIDLDARSVRVEHGKSPSARRVQPIPAPVALLLADQMEGVGPGEPVFPYAPLTVFRAWDRIRDWASLRDVRCHDLRHTYAVHMVKNGMSIVELKARMGHGSINTTLIYAAYQPDPHTDASRRGSTSMGY